MLNPPPRVKLQNCRATKVGRFSWWSGNGRGPKRSTGRPDIPARQPQEAFRGSSRAGRADAVRDRCRADPAPRRARIDRLCGDPCARPHTRFRLSPEAGDLGKQAVLAGSKVVRCGSPAEHANRSPPPPGVTAIPAGFRTVEMRYIACPSSSASTPCSPLTCDSIA